MNSKNQKIIKAINSIFIVILLIAMLLISASCSSNTKTGKIVGYHASFSLQEALEGEIKDLDFGGILIIELDDGTLVDAIWDNNLGDLEDLVGGQEVEITPTDDPDYWKVTKVFEYVRQ